ncbi:hypothetical protein K488DRAFT_75509 [Vararia minispora EC-137]|uniref:Uncharacterized protein n=1 Tax=Vararia minispora EC-137 TaxID=1314806 RepID=A0ACB8QZE7_9AGAM|nr:hypothetical protein K488DRAFT_75509 [Vararia minispora EC-137]
MSGSRSLEDTYEAQNDQRLDDLHAKIRTLRGVTTDIHDDVERQNLVLDNTGNTFSQLSSGLSASANRMMRSFSPGTLSILRIAFFIFGFFIGIWLVRLIMLWMGWM